MNKTIASFIVAGTVAFMPSAHSLDFYTDEEMNLSTSSSECSSDIQYFKYDVVGESHRKESLEQSLGERVNLDYPFAIKSANLVPEPSNKFDKNAVKVMVSNIHIGYVPKAYSKKISNYLKIKKATTIPTCIFWDNDSVGYQAFLNMDPYLKSIKKTETSWKNDKQVRG
jgi:hypothetical protein